MPDTITCSNSACGVTIDTAGKEIGESVDCPKCSTPNQVLATFGAEFALSVETGAKDGKPLSHPARLTCTACGAVLGVRDAICKGCGSDVRTGVSQIRITREEREKRGLFTRKPPSAPVGGRRAPVQARKGLPVLALVLVVAGVLIAAAVAAFLLLG